MRRGVKFAAVVAAVAALTACGPARIYAPAPAASPSASSAPVMSAPAPPSYRVSCQMETGAQARPDWGPTWAAALIPVVTIVNTGSAALTLPSYFTVTFLDAGGVIIAQDTSFYPSVSVIPAGQTAEVTPALASDDESGTGVTSCSAQVWGAS